MPPTQNERPQDVSSPEQETFGYPPVSSPVDLTSISTTLSEISFGESTSSIYEEIQLPREPTLKELVQKASRLDDISGVTQLKLQVISVDVSLQYLSYHCPLLRELILDGSIVSSLRDLGCGLKCLKILRVNRCGLKHLDGTFGLESLEELYATKNAIRDISPCYNLPNIKVLDVRKNCIVDIAALTFLSLCPSLEHLWLEENQDIVTSPQYRQTVKSLIPNLKTLDGHIFTAEECSIIENEVKNNDADIQIKNLELRKRESIFPSINSTASTNQLSTGENTYVVRFPPKVLSPRQSTSNEPLGNIQVNKVLPQISQSRSRKASLPGCSENQITDFKN